MIHTLTGTNSFALQSKLRHLTDDFVKRYGDINLDRIDAAETEADTILAIVKSSPFLSEKRLVIVRNPGQNKQLIERMEQLLSSVPEENEVYFVEPKPDKRSAYFKLLKSKTEFEEFKPLDERELARWAEQYASNLAAKITLSDAQYLIERVGANQESLAHELDKLAMYDKLINRKSIDALTDSAPRSSIFQLLDAAFSSNNQQVQKLYAEQRALGVEPLAMMGMIAWQLHILALVKAAGNKSSQQIASETKLNTFVVQKTQNIARRMTLEQVKVLVRKALELDIRLKSEPLDADEALQHFLLTIAIS